MLPLPPLKGGSKTQNRRFPAKVALRLKKFGYKVSVSDKVVRHSLAYLSVQKWFAGDVPYYVKIWPKPTNPLKKRRFPSNVRS